MSYQQSESIKELAAAMNKVQAKMGPVIKDKYNPFHKSKYADLNGIWDAISGLLTENDLVVIQLPDGDGLTTTVLHTSGEWTRATMALHYIPEVREKKMADGTYYKTEFVTPQAQGSAITYARRYALAAAIGVCPVDDDGEGAMQRGKSISDRVSAGRPTAKASKYVDQINGINALDDLHSWGDSNAAAIKELVTGDKDFLRSVYSHRESELLKSTESTGLNKLIGD